MRLTAIVLVGLLCRAIFRKKDVDPDDEEYPDPLLRPEEDEDPANDLDYDPEAA